MSGASREQLYERGEKSLDRLPPAPQVQQAKEPKKGA